MEHNLDYYYLRTVGDEHHQRLLRDAETFRRTRHLSQQTFQADLWLMPLKRLSGRSGILASIRRRLIASKGHDIGKQMG